jgi:restriction system protein
MTGWMAAALVGLAGLAATSLWFGLARRRRVEAELGVQALSNLKWREGIAVVLDALRSEGYEVDEGASVAGTESMLLKGGERILLDYKHGTSYCLGSQTVTEFFATLRLRGANRGILATLGTLEPGTAAAAGPSVQLLDGAHVWARVRTHVPEPLLEAIRRDAANGSRRGLWAGSTASAVLAGLAFFAVERLPTALASSAGGKPSDAPDVAVATPPPAPSAAPAADAAMQRLNAKAAALAEVARLSPDQLARRRADAARQVSALPQVDAAAWSAQRTLLLALNRTDGKDEALIAETCRILLQHEEMRYTRIQLNPPADATQAVRWRLCE